jgi:molybdenum cofactor cytidylyltransferase
MTTGGAVLQLLEAIVLAAGAGSRFGGGKLLAPWRDGVLLDGALTAAFASPARSVVVVWGADPAVAAAASAFADRSGEPNRLRVVHAARHADGLSASLAAGVTALPPDAEGAFVFLGDMPRIPSGLAAAMAETLEGGAAAVAPMFLGRRGHPVLFSRAVLPRLVGLSGDRGAGELLRELGAAVAVVESTDEGVLFDVDQPEDLAAPDVRGVRGL